LNHSLLPAGKLTPNLNFFDHRPASPISFLVLDQYSPATYFMALLCVIAMFLLSTGFQALYRTKPTPKDKKSKQRVEKDELANRLSPCGMTTYKAAYLGFMILNLTTKGSIGSFETMGISFVESHFDLQPAVAATIVSVCGVIGVAARLSVGYLGRFK
jgi:ceroid-lipofuscinosis MFS transporter 7